MEEIKILLITVRADHGGGPRHIDLLIENFSNKIKTFIACPTDLPYYNLWNNNNKVSGLTVIPHRKFSLLKLLELAKLIRENNISLVHSHGKGAGLYSRLLKLIIPSLQVIHTFHGVHTQEYGPTARRLYYLYERLAKNLTDKFVNVSFGERDICLAGGFCEESKQITIYNGVPNLGDNTETKANLADPMFRIISISRFDYSKNMQLAYEIAKTLNNRKLIQFIWVGDGTDKDVLERKAKEEGINNIVFTGFTNQPEVYLQKADAYLSTSRWEGLPLSLAEAASLGLPIIATNVTGNNEVVMHGHNGFLYDASNISQAAEYIIELHDNSQLYESMSYNAKEVYRQNFTVEKMVTNTEKVYFSSTGNEVS